MAERQKFVGQGSVQGHQHPVREPETGQRFEVQFHTRASFEAKQLTHAAYERLRILLLDIELDEPGISAQGFRRDPDPT